MFVFPLSAALISLAFAAVIGRDQLRRPRPEKLAWTIAFLTFAVAAGAEAVAVFDDWTPLLVRVFYLAGAVLVVGYLGLGELYLLAPRRIETLRVVPGLAILLTAIGATLVWAAPIDEARLAEDGWKAMERGPALVALVALSSGLGTVVLVGGALWSAWKFRRLGTQRHRMIGCLLIAVGTLTVAAKGTLGRTGLPEDAFAIALAVGVAIIFAGYLETRRRHGGAEGRRDATAAGRPPSLSVLPSRRPAVSDDAAAAFVEKRFLPLDDPALAELCRVWSVPRPDVDAFSRAQARRVWSLRLRLSEAGRARFDEHRPQAQLQLAELYHEVLMPEVGSSELVVPTRA